MCDIWKQRDGLTFHTADLERHRESIQRLDVKHVVLTGGEPLLNRELDIICRFFRDLKIRITLLTTGLLLSQKAESVADSFDDIIISLDGPPDIHDHIRRVKGAFASIQKGIAAVRSLRPKMPISCRTTVQKLNHAHLRSTILAAKSLELNSISFLSADVFSEAFHRQGGWSEERQNEVALTRSELYTLEHEIELLIATYSDEIRNGFITEASDKLRRITDRFRERLDHTLPIAPLCNAPWVSAVIDVDGSVRPCFFHAAVGNVNQLSLEKSVNSSAALNFRSTLDMAKNAICQRCVCSLNYRQ